jgi:hypothetical protein
MVLKTCGRSTVCKQISEKFSNLLTIYIGQFNLSFLNCRCIKLVLLPEYCHSIFWALNISFFYRRFQEYYGCLFLIWIFSSTWLGRVRVKPIAYISEILIYLHLFQFRSKEKTVKMLEKSVIQPTPTQCHHYPQEGGEGGHKKEFWNVDNADHISTLSSLTSRRSEAGDSTDYRNVGTVLLVGNGIHTEIF